MTKVVWMYEYGVFNGRGWKFQHLTWMKVSWATTPQVSIPSILNSNSMPSSSEWVDPVKAHDVLYLTHGPPHTPTTNAIIVLWKQVDGVQYSRKGEEKIQELFYFGIILYVCSNLNGIHNLDGLDKDVWRKIKQHEIR